MLVQALPDASSRRAALYMYLTPDAVPQSDWRQLDWSILTTVALVGPFEPELMCYAHSKGVRLVFGWDPGAFCPGPNGNNGGGGWARGGPGRPGAANVPAAERRGGAEDAFASLQRSIRGEIGIVGGLPPGGGPGG